LGPEENGSIGDLGTAGGLAHLSLLAVSTGRHAERTCERAGEGLLRLKPGVERYVGKRHGGVADQGSGGRLQPGTGHIGPRCRSQRACEQSRELERREAAGGGDLGHGGAKLHTVHQLKRSFQGVGHAAVS
jgi:hypothetical protein